MPHTTHGTPPAHGTDTAHDAAGGCAALARSGSAHDVQPAGLFGLSGLNDLNDINTARPSRFGHHKTNDYEKSKFIYLSHACLLAGMVSDITTFRFWEYHSQKHFKCIPEVYAESQI